MNFEAMNRELEQNSEEECLLPGEACAGFLPLGSVVTLFGGTKKIMIVGRMQQETDTLQLYDYAAVLWPEGVLNSDSLYLFNESDVDKLYFCGWLCEEENQFRDYLSGQKNQYQFQKKETGPDPKAEATSR